ncbi:hypothetical protein Pla52nx_002604 [Stieleria varia]
MNQMMERHRYTTILGELFAKFQTSFYSDPGDVAFKALGLE